MQKCRSSPQADTACVSLAGAVRTGATEALARYHAAREALRLDRLIEVSMWDVLVKCWNAKRCRGSNVAV